MTVGALKITLDLNSLEYWEHGQALLDIKKTEDKTIELGGDQDKWENDPYEETTEFIVFIVPGEKFDIYKSWFVDQKFTNFANVEFDEYED